MANGIVVFGANGCGKTTLGRELSYKLNCKHIDIEQYYFEESDIPYSKPRTKDSVIDSILTDVAHCDSFVFSAVTGDYGEALTSMFRLGVFLSAPLEIRLQRIEHRLFEQFGKRVLVGGDMYEQELGFLSFVKARNLSAIDEWAKALNCPILTLDGTKPISENIRLITDCYFHIK